MLLACRLPFGASGHGCPPPAREYFVPHQSTSVYYTACRQLFPVKWLEEMVQSVDRYRHPSVHGPFYRFKSNMCRDDAAAETTSDASSIGQA